MFPLSFNFLSSETTLTVVGHCVGYLREVIIDLFFLIRFFKQVPMYKTLYGFIVNRKSRTTFCSYSALFVSFNGQT